MSGLVFLSLFLQGVYRPGRAGLSRPPRLLQGEGRQSTITRYPVWVSTGIPLRMNERKVLGIKSSEYRYDGKTARNTFRLGKIPLLFIPVLTAYRWIKTINLSCAVY